jgi:hypothetical protein
LPVELPRPPVGAGPKLDVPVGVTVERLPPLPTETNGFADEVVADEVVKAKGVVDVKSKAPESQLILNLEIERIVTYLW